MKDEGVYQEFANWKLENTEFVNILKEKADSIYTRVKYVMYVLDFLYDRLIDDPNYSQEEHDIFTTGFYYLADQIEDVKKIVKDVYKNNVDLLEIYAKDIQLFLTAIEFQAEILNQELKEDQDIERLMHIDQDIYAYIEKKEAVPQETFEELDLISYKVFGKLNMSYYSINDIFFEIADEFNLGDFS